MRKTFEYETELEAPPERVFPLLCPVREREWIPGWRARVVYSQSGYAEDNALFRTHVDMGELWVTTRFEPDSFRVEYTVVIRNHAVLRLDLALIPGTGGVTRWRVRRTYTAVENDSERTVIDAVIDRCETRPESFGA